MNVPFSMMISLIAIFFMCQCSATNKSSDQKQIKVGKASYKNWTKPPLSTSDVPEKGTDLWITLEGWAKEAEPLHIIYNGRTSFPAEIVDSTANEITVKARIIISSSVLGEPSAKTSKTDRLVYRISDSTTSHIAIKSWKNRAKKEAE